MRKLILLVAVATTISFAACTNSQEKEGTEIENATEALEETVEDAIVDLEDAVEDLSEEVSEVLDEVTED